MKKRILSALLVLCLACGLVSTAWAADGQSTPETAAVSVTGAASGETAETDDGATPETASGETAATPAPSINRAPARAPISTYATNIDTITTLDTADEITINLYDYNDSDVTMGWDGKNILGNFDFGAYGSRDNSLPWNNWSGSSDGVTQGILRNTLEGQYPNSYPVFNDWTSNGKTLGQGGEGADWLFSIEGKNQSDYRLGLNNLFKKGVGQDAKYDYVYDSSQNFATIVDNNDKDFKVYDQFTTSTPKFMPFNDLSDGSWWGGKGSISGTSNYLFGMEIYFRFNQPQGGMIDDQNMEFTFSGDDDVWVFIDDVLVLDIGGIHGKMTGTIDFATGDVTVSKLKNQSGGQNTTLYKLFEAAGRENADNISWRPAEEGKEPTTFADFTGHTLKFYYLERGENQSNCSLKFNLQPIPADDLIVTKNAENAPASDTSYTFQLTDENGNEQANQTYDVYSKVDWQNNGKDATPVPTSQQTDGEGKFTLKADQVAVFDGFFSTEKGNASKKYKVTEITDGLNPIPSEIKLEGGTAQDTTAHSITVGYQNNSATFTNIYPKTGSLTINKQVSSNVTSLVGSQQYSFTITPEAGLSVEWNKVSVSGNAVLAENSANKTATVTLTGATAVTLSGLPAGKYTVQENTVSADLNGQYYFSDESYSAGEDDGLKVTCTENSATATIAAGDQVQINVTNTYKSYKTLTITKSVTGAMGSDDDWFNFSVSGNCQFQPTGDQIPATGSGAAFRLNNGSSITLTKLKAGDTITITEQSNNNGYTFQGVTTKANTVGGYVLTKKNGGAGDYADISSGIQITVPDTDVVDLGTVTFTNERKAVAPTGLESNHTAPYTILVTVAGIAGLALIGGIVARRRRRME